MRVTLYVVRTANGKTLSGFYDRDDADESVDYWQARFDNNPLTKGVRVEIREVSDGGDGSDED